MCDSSEPHLIKDSLTELRVISAVAGEWGNRLTSHMVMLKQVMKGCSYAHEVTAVLRI